MGWESWTKLTAPVDGDIAAIQDVSDTTGDATGTTKYLLLSDLWGYIDAKITAAGVPITDTGGLFAAEDVEAALAEVRAAAPIAHYGYDPPIPVGWMMDGASPPDAIDMTTRKPIPYRTFSNSADEDLNMLWFVPSDMNPTDTRTWFRVKYLVTAATGPTASEGVAWGLSGVVAGDNDPSNYSKGTVAVVTDDELNASQWDILITDWAAVTISGIEPGGLGELNILRDVSDLVDNYAQLVGLIAIEIRYIKIGTVPA